MSIKAAKELVDRGFKAAEIRKALEEVRATLPHVDRPLDRIRVAFDGDRLVVVDEGGAYETTGQKVFDFGLAELAHHRPRIAEVRPGLNASGHAGGRQAHGLRLVRRGHARRDGGRRRGRRARRGVLRQGPRARRGPRGGAHEPRRDRPPTRRRGGGARGLRGALALDPDQVEARFNLANLILESGDLELAVAEFRRVLQVAPDFADGHYNLAVALERLGGRAPARAHLEHYLSLEPEATPWAEQARALIERLD